MKIHPSMKRKLETFIDFRLFQCLNRIRFSRITDNDRRDVGVHVSRTDMGQLHAFFISKIAAGLEKFFRQVFYRKQENKLFLMGSPELVGFEEKILLRLS